MAVIKTLVSFVALVIVTGDCFGPTTPPNAKRYFVVTIDSVQYEPSIVLGDTAVLRLYGFIGYNLCYGLDRFESHFQPLRLDLTAWGVYPAHPYVCAQVVSRLYGEKFSFVPTAQGEFIVVIHQASGSTLQLSFGVQ